MEFEKKLKKLEGIVADMEKGELSLEDSLKHFEQGVQLSRECQTQLSEAEQKVQVLMGVDDSGEPQTKNFAAQD